MGHSCQPSLRRVPLGVRPHIFGWDVAQGMICPSAHARAQEEPRTLQARQVWQMDANGPAAPALPAGGAVSPFAHVIAVSDWDS